MVSVRNSRQLLDISFLENIKEELICSICDDEFRDAVIFRCSHTYCKSCIEKWLANHHTCPICVELILERPIKNRIVDCIVALKHKYDAEKIKFKSPKVTQRKQESCQPQSFKKIYTELPPLEELEFKNIPQYLIGSIKFHEIESFITAINTALRKKYRRRSKALVPLPFKNTISEYTFKTYGFLTEGELLNQLKCDVLNKRNLKVLVILKRLRITLLKKDNCTYIIPVKK